MKNKTGQIFIVLSVLTILSLSCSFLSSGDKSTKTPDAETPSPTSGKSNSLLGEEYRSESGGFSLLKVKNYQFKDVIGIVNMSSLDSDPDIGPGIMVMGGNMEKDYTNEQLFQKMELDSKTLKLSNSKKIKVSGVNGLIADVDGKYNDQSVKGKVVLAMVTPTQQFNMMGIAPADRWKELSPIYDAVLGSINFFEPKPEAVTKPVESPTEKTQTDTPQNVNDSAFIHQWASSAKASSSYSNQAWDASQATGGPNVNTCGDNGLAWASKGTNTVEWIELTYNIPVTPTEINIYQSYNPSQVVEVYMTDVNGKKYIVWNGEPEKVKNCPDLMTITLDLDKKIRVNNIRIVVDQSVMGWGWDEIDAVELVGYNEDVQSKPTPNPQKTGPSSNTPDPSSNVSAPTNYTGWMTEPVYQGYLKVIPGKTRVEELNNLIGIKGSRSTDSWKPRPDHADTYIFKLVQDNMMAWISINKEGVVYKKAISSNTHPSDYKLDTVSKETYNRLDAIFKRDKVLPYNVTANMLKSPGFLMEQNLQEDGRMADTYQWYNANGDYINGFFYNGSLTGIAGLAFIPHQ